MIPRYITGTLTYTTDSGESRRANAEQARPGELCAQAQDTERWSFFTTNDLVIVETYYHHNQVLNAPLIEWVIPEPIVLYMRTAMRISTAPRRE